MSQSLMENQKKMTQEEIRNYKLAQTMTGLYDDRRIGRAQSIKDSKQGIEDLGFQKADKILNIQSEIEAQEGVQKLTEEYIQSINNTFDGKKSVAQAEADVFAAEIELEDKRKKYEKAKGTKTKEAAEEVYKKHEEKLRAAKAEVGYAKKQAEIDRKNKKYSDILGQLGLTAGANKKDIQSAIGNYIDPWRKIGQKEEFLTQGKDFKFNKDSSKTMEQQANDFYNVLNEKAKSIGLGENLFGDANSIAKKISEALKQAGEQADIGGIMTENLSEGLKKDIGDQGKKQKL